MCNQEENSSYRKLLVQHKLNASFHKILHTQFANSSISTFYSMSDLSRRNETVVYYLTSYVPYEH